LTIKSAQHTSGLAAFGAFAPELLTTCLADSPCFDLSGSTPDRRALVDAALFSFQRTLSAERQPTPPSASYPAAMLNAGFDPRCQRRSNPALTIQPP
jgi:hypothetical protein